MEQLGESYTFLCGVTKFSKSSFAAVVYVCCCFVTYVWENDEVSLIFAIARLISPYHFETQGSVIKLT